VAGKALALSRDNRVIAGVCGGIAEYFGIDPTFVRVLAVILAFAGGFGLVPYLLCWLIMPRR
jgi:phage shock protein C